MRDVARLLRLAERDDWAEAAVASNDAISARTAGSPAARRAKSSLRSRYIRSKALSAAAALGRAGALAPAGAVHRRPPRPGVRHLRHRRRRRRVLLRGVGRRRRDNRRGGSGRAARRAEVHRPGVDGSSTIDDAVGLSFHGVQPTGGREGASWVVTRRRVARAPQTRPSGCGRRRRAAPRAVLEEVARAVAESGWHVEFHGLHLPNSTGPTSAKFGLVDTRSALLCGSPSRLHRNRRITPAARAAQRSVWGSRG